MSASKEPAAALLKAWKGDSYIFGLNVLDRLGTLVKKFGKKALVVSCNRQDLNDRIIARLKSAGITIAGIAPGAKPNAPREDVYRLESYIQHYNPDLIVVVGGGSTIDCTKAANMLATLGGDMTPEIDHYFGTGLVSEALKKTGKTLRPLIAVETSASSGAHLTKYANITDPVVGQKKLIVDEALVPPAPFFDYATTVTMPVSVTIDGALDAIAHTFEVFCGAKGDVFEKARQLAETAIDLVAEYAKVLTQDPKNLEAREAIGLATDLGAYAIMIGGTSGAHLTSFSLVDIVSHGTACGIMNPYYAIFYSTAIQPQLQAVGKIFAKHGYIIKNLDSLTGRDLALAVSEGMIAFASSINAPTKLSEVKGFTEGHITRALNAAKDPQLEMKLKNMPVPLTAADVDTYMQPILRAAATGDLSIIKEMC
ncbi:MAG: iron-containing alcohol dehydrogenase [Treponema sp.]|jgi:alcohol dehydrogenase|nr:iron-containing alcohol dehydrogenase [Treponema sp.]